MPKTQAGLGGAHGLVGAVNRPFQAVEFGPGQNYMHMCLESVKELLRVVQR